jgi:hypothetical protein
LCAVVVIALDRLANARQVLYAHEFLSGQPAVFMNEWPVKNAHSRVLDSKAGQSQN